MPFSLQHAKIMIVWNSSDLVKPNLSTILWKWEFKYEKHQILWKSKDLILTSIRNILYSFSKEPSGIAWNVSLLCRCPAKFKHIKGTTGSGCCQGLLASTPVFQRSNGCAPVCVSATHSHILRTNILGCTINKKIIAIVVWPCAISKIAKSWKKNSMGNTTTRYTINTTRYF